MNLFTPTEVQARLSADVKRARKHARWTQQDMSERTGLPYSTYRLFESTGQTSLANFVKIVGVLGSFAPLQELFPDPEYESLDDIDGL